MINRKPKDVIVLHVAWIYHWYYKPNFMRMGKHLAKVGTSFCLSCAIGPEEVKVWHMITIIWFSPLSVRLYTTTSLMGSLLLRKIDVSFLMHRSVTEWFLGEDRWAVFPSIDNKKYFHWMSILVHLKSFENTNSVLSVPNQPYWSLVRFGKVEVILSSDHIVTFFATISITRNNDIDTLLWRLARKYLMLSANVNESAPLFIVTFIIQVNCSA